jgi:glycosyltransferase involved in cell wall biosynthesis
MSQNRSLVSIIAPCYNEVGNVDACYARIRKLFEGDGAPLAGYDWELIFCDNASQDGTQARLRAIAADLHVKVILNASNFGPNPSLFNGCFAASGDAVVFQSADLQDPPELISEYIRLWREGSEVVFATSLGMLGPELVKSFQRDVVAARLGHHSGFALETRTSLEAVTPSEVTLRGLDSGRATTVEADLVVLVTGFEPQVALYRELVAAGVEAHLAGDAVAPLLMQHAIASGHAAGVAV